jgi:DNA-binding GntR family transcriptional regulator
MVEEQPSSARAPVASANTRRAYDAIRESIGTGDFAPGAWLRESSVAATLGLSRTPVREALRMLATEGVVELVHNRGARVVRWSAADIDEVYRLRALLEGYGAALAARNATRAQITEIRSLEERYERALDLHESAQGMSAQGMSAQCNNAFHAAVLAASGSPRLETLLELISSAHLVTQALQHYSDDDRRRSILQHRDIVTALQNGDESLSESAMRSHILAARYTALRLARADQADTPAT